LSQQNHDPNKKHAKKQKQKKKKKKKKINAANCV